MTKTAIVSKSLAPPVGPFSQGIRANGLLFLSGQVGRDPATGKLVPGGIRAETDQVLKNLAAVLESAGKTLTDVLRAGVFLTDMGDFPAMNAVYEKHFVRPYPVRTTVAVGALPLGARVEIDLVVAG
jgi:2-iminobutanoate/2-iminopropanoate deaminase